jgi:hypothetical protein
VRVGSVLEAVTPRIDSVRRCPRCGRAELWDEVFGWLAVESPQPGCSTGDVSNWPDSTN